MKNWFSSKLSGILPHSSSQISEIRLSLEQISRIRTRATWNTELTAYTPLLWKTKLLKSGAMKSSSRPVGKNFSCNNVSGLRKKSDFYETPYSLTRLLLENEDFSKCNSILEPACGNGAIVHVVKKYGLKGSITAYDREVDFLKEEKKYSCAITNPPFSLAKEFILKAKQVCTTKFAFLLPLSYLHGKERFDLIYSDTKYPLKKVWIFTRYPLLGEDLRADGKMNTGMMVYAWVVWQKRYKGEPTIGWLDNDEYIIRKK